MLPMPQTPTNVQRISVAVLSLVLCVSALPKNNANGQDATDDPSIQAGSANIVDAFDFMVLNHALLTPGQQPQADLDADGDVDGDDYLQWQNSLFTGCTATIPCVLDAQYKTAFPASPINIPIVAGTNLSNPVFLPNVPSAGWLSVKIPTGVQLHAVTVTTPSAALSFDPLFDPSVFSPFDPSIVGSYHNGRHQWFVDPFYSVQLDGTGVDIPIAKFSPGVLNSASIFWQTSKGTGTRGLNDREVFTGSTTVPEPATLSMLFLAAFGLFVCRRRFGKAA